jgi:hypothetical protein
LLRQSDDIRRLKLKLFAALFNSGKIENVFDEGREPSAFLHNKVEIIVLFSRIRYPAMLQALRH